MTKQLPLTPGEAETLAHLRSFLELHGFAPSLQDLQVAAGLASKSSVSYRLRRLMAKGWIVREPGIARAVRIVAAPSPRSPQGDAA